MPANAMEPLCNSKSRANGNRDVLFLSCYDAFLVHSCSIGQGIDRALRRRARRRCHTATAKLLSALASRAMVSRAVAISNSAALSSLLRTHNIGLKNLS